MPPTLRVDPYELDFDALYAQMWALATPEPSAATRLYEPSSRESLKWLIADLTGTPAISGRTMPENNMLRREVHRVLDEEGWAERLTETRFRLLRPPADEDPYAYLHGLMSLIPSGRWTTYGDLASLTGIHSRGLGSHIKHCPHCPHAVRVLTAGGRLHGDGFVWTDPNRRGADPNKVLAAQGVRIDGSHASGDQYVSAPDLIELLGVRQGVEGVAWPTIEWVKVPVDRVTEEPNGTPIRMRHFLDCSHWFRSETGRLLGAPPRLATTAEMRDLPACATCVANAVAGHNPPFGSRLLVDDLDDVLGDTQSAGGEQALGEGSATDGVAWVAVRREQRYLRQHLLRGRSAAPCSICTRVLPSQLLVAAHIAPRRTLSEAERLDYARAAMLACSLGCDALFELGYITVDDGGRVVSSREVRSSDLQLTVSVLLGRKVAAFGPETAPKFALHRALHQG